MATEDRVQHTPGPWALELPHEEGKYLNIITQDERYDEDTAGICFVFHTLSAADLEGWANARLIAAAPDMLAALMQVLDAYETGGEFDVLGAQTAIKRAGGVA